MRTNEHAQNRLDWNLEVQEAPSNLKTLEQKIIWLGKEVFTSFQYVQETLEGHEEDPAIRQAFNASNTTGESPWFHYNP